MLWVSYAGPFRGAEAKKDTMMGVLEVVGAFKRLLGLSDELVHGKLLQACEKGESRLMDGRKDKSIRLV